jgi:hypothetical protein
MMTPPHPLNWFAGWCMLLGCFAAGAVIGLFFHREGFLGGYGSFSRRLLRLGHIAMAALGMINLLFSFSPWPSADTDAGAAASIAFVVGGAAMPTVCFLTAWRMGFRHLFFIPVTALLVAGIATLRGGMP